MRRPSLLATALACCVQETPVDRGPPLNHDLPGQEAGSNPPEPPPLTARCDPTDNALRFLCTVSVIPPQPVEVTFALEDGSGSRTHGSDLEASRHEIGLYFMAPESAYRWEARSSVDPSLPPATGTLLTGSLPPGAEASFQVDAGRSTSPMIGMVSPCNEGGVAVVLDPESNQVLWYQDLASSPMGSLDAVSFTEDHTVLGIVDDGLHEVDLMGRTLLRLYEGVDLPRKLHHDAFRKDGLIWVLFQEPVQLDHAQFTLDGFYVLSGEGELLAEWHLLDHFAPEPYEPSPFSHDYSHANAIWVDDHQNVLISFRHLSAIAMIDGRIGTTGFGAITWRLSNPSSAFGTDFLLTSAVGPPADFERQHNPHFLPDGSLVMFDNRLLYDDPSRVLQLSIDPRTAQAVIRRQFVMPKHCDFQGGAMQTPAGNLLATCAPGGYGYEFDYRTSQVRWHGNAICNLGFGGYIPRLVPIAW